MLEESYTNTYKIVIDLLNRNEFRVVKKYEDFLLDNYNVDFKKSIYMAKLMFIKDYKSNMPVNLLNKIISDQNITEDDKNDARYQLSRGYVKLRLYQKAFDTLLFLTKTTYADLAYIEMGRILFFLGYNEQSIKAFNFVKDKAKIKSLGIDLGRLNMPQKKYIAASYNFCDLVSDEKYKADALVQMLYLHIKNGNYEKAMEYFKSLSKEKVKKQDDLMHIYYYLVSKCPKLKDDSYVVKKDTFTKQIDNYDINLMYRKFPETFYDKKTSDFLDGVSLSNIFTYAKAYVDYSNPNKIAFVEYYYFDYKENVVSINGIETRRIKVGTLPNSKDIISIHAVPLISNPNAFIRKK